MTRPFRASLAPLAVPLLLALAAAACSQGPSTTGGPGATGAAQTPGGVATAPGATSGSGSGTSRAACDLLSDDDIEEITGFTVAEKDPEPMDTVYENVCRWTFNGPGTMDLGVLDVDAMGFMDRTIELEGGTEIAGLGDRAVRLETTTAIMALRGDTLVDLFILGAGTPDAVEEALVRRAIENLGG